MKCENCGADRRGRRYGTGNGGSSLPQTKGIGNSTRQRTMAEDVSRYNDQTAKWQSRWTADRHWSLSGKYLRWSGGKGCLQPVGIRLPSVPHRRIHSFVCRAATAGRRGYIIGGSPTGVRWPDLQNYRIVSVRG